MQSESLVHGKVNYRGSSMLFSCKDIVYFLDKLGYKRIFQNMYEI